jgi:hypothetical protein
MGTATTSTTLPSSWAILQAAVIGPNCASCHGGSGGLSGLEACGSGYASLVGVPSVQLPTMKLVEPGNPAASWLVHKLDGTQNGFDAQCAGGSCGAAMPVGQPLLPPAVRDAIRAWIAGGAANDCP